MDCHVTSGVCHLYTLCASCNNTVPKRAFSNHICSKKRCAICSVHYSFADRKNNSFPSSEHQCFVQRPKRYLECETPGRGHSDETVDFDLLGGEEDDGDTMTRCKRRKLSCDSVGVANATYRDQSANNYARAPSDDNIWIFDIETDQSCVNEGLHKPILLAAESLTGDEVIYIGYDCINNFCEDVFAGIERVRRTEWFIAHFGSGFDFLPILEWLYKQHKYIPKILLRGNKVVSMRVGNKRFIDSYLFIPIPLSKFATTFNLKEVKKGYFPHFLTSKEALYPTASSKLHSFQTCEKGESCSMRQVVSADCSHCVAGQSNASCFNANSRQTELQEFALKAGQFPPACLFALNTMKGQQTVSTFLAWHSAQTQFYRVNNLTYDFEQELVSYCQSDVKLLKEGFMEFRALIRKVCNGIDPFEVACTAASACNYIYRQLFMPKDSIAILPQNGYTGNELTSFPAAIWLSWVEQVASNLKPDEFSIRLYKSGGGLKRGRGKEQTLGSFKIDGLLLYKHTSQPICATSNDVVQRPHRSIVLEFFGCYFHGCPSCYPDRNEVNKKRNATTMHDLYSTTVVDRLEWIAAQSSCGKVFTTTDNLRFVVDSIFFIWECEFKKLLELTISQDDQGTDTALPHLPKSVASRLSPFPSETPNATQQNENRITLQQTRLYSPNNIQILQKMSDDSIRYSPLQPRDAFFGGRTENFVLKWSRQLQSQTLKYVDVCSLYPYVNSKSVYPSGHPDLILIATEQQQQSFPKKDMSRCSKSSATEKPSQTSCVDDVANIVQDRAVEIKFLDRVDRILAIPSSEGDLSHHFDAGQQQPSPSRQRLRKFSQRTLSEFPHTYVESKLRNEDFFGLIKCQVLPPSDLHLPILPFKFQSKLFFPLCRRCVEERSSIPDKKCVDLTSKKCVHRRVEDRSFWGTFATPEVKLALENGYRVIDVAEIWSWSRKKRSVTLFKDYIDKVLKIKLEASGWPKSCSCDEDTSAAQKICEHKRLYLREMEKKEGIALDPAKRKKRGSTIHC